MRLISSGIVNLVKTEHRTIRSDFDPQYSAIWKASDWQKLHFSVCKHIANTIKAYLNRKINIEWNAIRHEFLPWTLTLLKQCGII